MSDEALELLIRRLDRIERLILDQKAIREWYSTEEFAAMVCKAEFTVREWCRHGRISASRGGSCAWAISHEEFLRYQREGLLPWSGP